MVKRYDVYEDAEFGTMREYCETGCHVDADDAVALAESHARLLEALIRLNRQAGENRPIAGALKQADEAIAAAQPFTDMGETK